MTLRITCTKCGTEKLATKSNFPPSAIKSWKEQAALGREHRFPVWCKPCQKVYNQARYAKIKEQKAKEKAEAEVKQARIELAPAQLIDTVDTLRVELSMLRTTIRAMTETVSMLQQSQISMNREMRKIRELIEQSE